MQVGKTGLNHLFRCVARAGRSVRPSGGWPAEGAAGGDGGSGRQPRSASLPCGRVLLLPTAWFARQHSVPPATAPAAGCCGGCCCTLNSQGGARVGLPQFQLSSMLPQRADGPPIASAARVLAGARRTLSADTAMRTIIGAPNGWAERTRVCTMPPMPL